MNPPLQSLFTQHNLWRATDLSPSGLSPGTLSPGTLASGHASKKTGLATGCAVLDRLLPDGGWPQADLVELLCNVRGIGELRLLMPALAQLSREQPRWIAWIAPPHIPYAPALAAHGVDISRILLIHPRTARDNLWALEQAMKTGTCSAVLGWPTDELRHQDIRRLQVAAHQGGTLGLLFRSEQVALQASPAPFRLVIRPLANPQADDCQNTCGTRLQIKLLKRRGGWATDFTPVQLGANPAAQTPAAQTLKGFQQQLSLWREERRREQRCDRQRGEQLPANSLPNLIGRTPTYVPRVN